MALALGELLRQELPTVQVLAGGRGLNRQVSHVVMVNPSRRGAWEEHVEEGGLYFLPAWTRADESPALDVLVRRLAASEAAGLVLERPRALPQAVLLLADRAGLPLLDLGTTGIVAVVERLAVRRQEDLLSAYRRADAAVGALLEAWRAGRPAEALLDILERELEGEAELVAVPARHASGPNADAQPRVQEAGDGVTGEMTLPVDGRTDYLFRLRARPRPHQTFVIRRVMTVAGVLLERLLEERHRKWESRLRSKADLVRELFASPGTPPSEVLARAWQAGWNPSAPHVMAALQVHDLDDFLASRGWTEAQVLEMQSAVLHTLESELGRAGLWAFAALGPDGRFVVAMRLREQREPLRVEAARPALERAVRHVRRLGYGFLLDGVLSGPAVGWEGIRQAYREAVETLRLVAAVRGAGALVTVEELGPERLLQGWYRSAEAASFARQLLAPVLAFPDPRRKQLLETVEAYLRERGDVGRAAQRLAIHRNTARYRLRQFEDLSGLSLERDFFLLEVAIRVLHAQAR
ncbi:MAG: helix-turn-helix domain-containing protein [Bacillota bacterium]|nr:helix-turn-helix domain-containing protein [Bacillota bacterium]